MKLDINTYKEIADSLLRNRSRSLLTGFGIFWGLFMLLFMLGGGDGLVEILRNTFDGFATNATIIYSDVTTKPYKGLKNGRVWWLHENDANVLRSTITELETVTPVIVSSGVQANNGIYFTKCSLKGIYSEYGKVEEPKMAFGRYINKIDILQNRKVCVLGKRVYSSIFPDGGDPCGTFIQIGPSFYKVIGVDNNPGNLSVGGSASQTIYIPFPVMKKLYNTGGRVNLISLTGKEGVKMTEIERRIRIRLSRIHSIHPNDKPAIGVINTEQLFGIMENIFSGVHFLVWLVGIGTILAGAIGVSNIIMVTVKERTSEIGIRRAIGATPIQILSQILLESISLTLTAGLAGIVFSVGILWLMEEIVVENVTFQIGFWTAAGAAFSLSLLGALAGLAPALRAMEIRPVDAMRDE